MYKWLETKVVSRARFDNTSLNISGLITNSKGLSVASERHRYDAHRRRGSDVTGKASADLNPKKKKKKKKKEKT